MTKSQKKLWVGLFILALLSPLGVIVPAKFKAGGAWGEWGHEELEKLIGYVPEGLRKMSGLWKAPIPDYRFGEVPSVAVLMVSYIVSALLGIVAIGLVVYLISRFIIKK